MPSNVNALGSVGHLWATFGSHGPLGSLLSPSGILVAPYGLLWVPRFFWVLVGSLGMPFGPFGPPCATCGLLWSIWKRVLCATFDILWALWYPVDPFGLILVPLATFGYWSLIPFWGVLLSPLGHLSLSLEIRASECRDPSVWM